MNTKLCVHRGEIYYADMSPVIGSEQGGLRPVVIIQNELGNKHAPTVIVAPLTSHLGKHTIPTHVALLASETGLRSDSLALLEQIRCIDKRRLSTKVGEIPSNRMGDINKAIEISLGLV